MKTRGNPNNYALLADIKAARQAAHHTQTQAAAVLGVSMRTWQKWESGETRMLASLLRCYRYETGLGSPSGN